MNSQQFTGNKILIFQTKVKKLDGSFDFVRTKTETQTNQKQFLNQEQVVGKAHSVDLQVDGKSGKINMHPMWEYKQEDRKLRKYLFIIGWPAKRCLDACNNWVFAASIFQEVNRTFEGWHGEIPRRRHHECEFLVVIPITL